MMRRLQNQRYLIMGLVIAVLIIQFRAELFSWGNKKIEVADLDVSKEYTAISLPKFQKAVQDTLDRGLSLDNDLRTMYGVTEFKGISYKPATGECIIFGLCDKSKPPMNIDDFVVAIKETFSGEVPGVTIDPVDPRDFGGTQTVKFFGQHTSASQFGFVLFDADYQMKQLCAHKVPTGVPDFKSYYELAMEDYESELKRCNGDVSPHEESNRFWFYPTDPIFVRNGNDVIIRDYGVQLLTEKQLVDKTKGKIKNLKGKMNSHAATFSKEFSRRYEEIATTHPRYLRLKSLFNQVVISRLMLYERVDLKNANYFLKDFVVSKYETPQEVAGINISQEMSHTINNPHYGECIHKVIFSGGVSINVPVTKKTFFIDKLNVLPKLHDQIYTARPSVNAVVWKFKFYELL